MHICCACVRPEVNLGHLPLSLSTLVFRLRLKLTNSTRLTELLLPLPLSARAVDLSPHALTTVLEICPRAPLASEHTTDCPISPASEPRFGFSDSQHQAVTSLLWQLTGSIHLERLQQ